MLYLLNETVLSKSVGWKPSKEQAAGIGLICHINVKRNQETGNRQTDNKGGGSGMAGVAFAIPLFSSIGNATPHLKAT